MESWKKHGVNFNHDATRTRSNGYRKPPLGASSNWQQSFPSWEKRFCESVGTIPWRKFVEMKKFVYLYDNIIKWDDSAGEEAFRNAKNRFYANLHGLPCNIELPDPDACIDKINWNSQVDPNLILELERDPGVPDAYSNEEQVVIFGDDFPHKYQNYSPYGWGDSDDDKKKDANAKMSPENVATGWDDGGGARNDNNWWGWNENDDRVKGDPGLGWNLNNCFYGEMNNEGGGRYKSSRNQRNESRNGRKWSGNGGGGGGGGHWKGSHYYKPVRVSSAAAGADRWSVKKPVS